MADVQLEHGHVRIARGFLDALLLQRLTGRQWTVFLAVLRLTWGWDQPPYARKMGRISSRHLARMTGIAERNIRVELDSLRKRKILGRRRDGQWYLWGIRKDFDQWRGKVRSRATPVAGDPVAGERTTALKGERTSALTGDPPLKIEEKRIRRANSRSLEKSQLTPLGDTIRSLEL